MCLGGGSVDGYVLYIGAVGAREEAMKAILIFPKPGDYFPQGENVHEIDIPDGAATFHSYFVNDRGVLFQPTTSIPLPRLKRKVNKQGWILEKWIERNPLGLPAGQTAIQVSYEVEE